MGFAVVVKQFRSDFEAVVDLIRRIEVGGQPLGLGDNGLFAHFRVVGIGKTQCGPAEGQIARRAWRIVAGGEGYAVETCGCAQTWGKRGGVQIGAKIITWIAGLNQTGLTEA